jgi:hypothetical protein
MDSKDTNDIATDVDYIEQESQPLKKRGRGRPRKSEIEARKKPGKVGRPAGDAAAIREYKARLLASPKSRKVLDSILNAALDDEHKNQAAAWKLLVDRLMPISYFEKDKEGGGRAAVNITISGVGGETIEIGGAEQEAIDGEYYENE